MMTPGVDKVICLLQVLELLAQLGGRLLFVGGQCEEYSALKCDHGASAVNLHLGIQLFLKTRCSCIRSVEEARRLVKVITQSFCNTL